MSTGTPSDKYAWYYPEPVDRPHATLAGMVSALDNYVGQIVAQLEDQGIADNTLIIFTSDNGPHDEGGGDPEFFKASAPYKGMKRDLYDGGIHVPMIVLLAAHLEGTGRRHALGFRRRAADLRRARRGLPQLSSPGKDQRRFDSSAAARQASTNARADALLGVRQTGRRSQLGSRSAKSSKPPGAGHGRPSATASMPRSNSTISTTIQAKRERRSNRPSTASLSTRLREASGLRRDHVLRLLRWPHAVCSLTPTRTRIWGHATVYLVRNVSSYLGMLFSIQLSKPFSVSCHRGSW